MSRRANNQVPTKSTNDVNKPPTRMNDNTLERFSGLMQGLGNALTRFPDVPELRQFVPVLLSGSSQRTDLVTEHATVVQQHPRVTDVSDQDDGADDGLRHRK